MDFDSRSLSNDRLRCCVSSVCGWRGSNEDAHMAELNIGDGNALFGVFDGHGGGEVAQWVAKNFAKELKKNQKYK